MTLGDDRQPENLLLTKLHASPISGRLLCRQRLHRLLDRGLTTPLTLVSAPAGYGKSTVVSHWFSAMDEPRAWVSLDEDDSDPRVFLKYALTAIRTVLPDSCLETEKFISASSPPPLAVVIRTLANELDAVEESLILVLDDYHRIPSDSLVHDIINAFLEHPPRSLHLIVLTRRDPPLRLAALRGRGLVTEVRLHDLQFTVPETLAFSENAGLPSLSDAAVTKLHHHAEGWAVGLYLVVLYLQTVSDPEAVLLALEGGILHTRDYLLQEVVDHLSAEMRTRLFETSVLDRFCGELCDAVRGDESAQSSAGLDGQHFIDELQRRNLFIVPLDSRGRWFRYHHLFQELLVEKLSECADCAKIAMVQTRASEWFEAHGLVDEAIHYALAAGNPDRAAAYIESHWRPAMLDANWSAVTRWLTKMPNEVVGERPQLLLAQAWGCYAQHDIKSVEGIMDRIEDCGEIAEDESGFSAEIAVFRGYVACFRGECADSLRQIEYALTNIPPGDVPFRAQAEIIFGLAGQMDGQLQRVTEEVTAWLNDPETIGTIRERSLRWILLTVHYLDADLIRALTDITDLRRIAVSVGDDNFMAWSDYFEGLIQLQRGDLQQAIGFLEGAGEKKYSHFPKAAADAIGALAVAYQANGQPEQAGETLRTLEVFTKDFGGSFLEFLTSLAVRLELIAGRTGRAVRWLETNPFPRPQAGLTWFVRPCVTYIRALLASGSQANFAEAEDRLRALVAANRTNHNRCQLINLMALLAVACAKQEKLDEAHLALGEALELAQHGGFVFPFLEIGRPMAALLAEHPVPKDNSALVERIRSALAGTEKAQAVGGRPRRTVPGLVEPLTTREAEILGLLAQRLRDKEIAERLFITPSTVNSHTKTLYHKLGVRNRRAAVARGSELGILEEN